MPISAEGSPIPPPGNRPVYRKSFLRHSHALIQLGYDRLNAGSYAASAEEDITGELLNAMRIVLEDRDAPSWAKHFWAEEEERVHDAVRLGKHRLRIDIVIRRHQAGPRPSFRIEAKRLTNSKSRRAYLGTDGLGCYLEGSYATDDQIAGMLGYVQQGTIDEHAGELERILGTESGRYCVAENGQWAIHDIAENLPTYRSIHVRKSPLGEITILHSFLSFQNSCDR